MATPSHELILASASPRRRELLAQLDLRFTIAPAHIDESVLPGESPEAYVVRMASEKTRAGLSAASGKVCVLGADTTVVCAGQILGKPANKQAGLAMMAKLSDSTHEVLRAVAVGNTERLEHRLSVTRVRFCPISEAAARSYWETGEPADKAGGYGIQGFGAVFVEHISGSYSGVVGLPLYETAELFRIFGFSPGIAEF